MKQVTRVLLPMIALGMLVSVSFAQQRQQQPQQPQQREAPHKQLLGDSRVQSALILCDAFMLNDEEAEQAVQEYQKIGVKIRQEWQDSGVNFQEMSNEEQRNFFEEYRKKVAAEMKKSIEKLLDEEEVEEEELDGVEEIMMITTFTPVPEIRGLRLIDLKDEQREKIRSSAISLSKKIVSPNAGILSEDQDESEREKAEKEFNEEKSEYIAEVKEVLNEEQTMTWQKKVEEINEALNEMRQRMRGGQNR